MAEVKLTVLGEDKSGPARMGLAATEKAIGMVKTAAATLGVSLSAMALFKYAEDAAMMTARYNTMGATMTVVGNNAGYTRDQMDGFETSLRKTGIAMIESRETLTKMASAHIDLAKSAELARIAQDAAVIGGINSSEAFSRMVQGIQSAEVEVLRNIGINVNFEDSYKKMSKQLGKNADDLTEYEKVQARTNAVIEKGKDIAGAYDAAMGMAGKQITSMKRYMDDFKVKAGEVFQDALTVAVGWATDGLKGLNKEAEDLAKKKQLDQWGRDTLMAMAFVADGVQGVVKLFTAATKTIIWSAQEIFGWASIARNALSGDFAAVGAWWDWMTQKTNEYNASMAKTADVTSFQDRAKAYLGEKDAAMKNVEALKAQEQARIKAGAASRGEQEAKAKQEASEKSFLADLKNNITGIKDYASAMKDLGKERLALSNDRYQEKLKQEIDLYKDGTSGLDDMIKPLRLYNTEVNGVYNERLANERSALEKIAGLYSEFRSKVTITANVKEVKQQGVEILREVKAQAEQIIAVESDRYKTLIAGEQAYASAVLGLIQAKKNEIKDLQNRLKDMDKTFEEQKRTASGDYRGGYEYLNPNLDAYQKRQANIDKLRRDEAEALKETDPTKKTAMLQKVSEGWAGLGEAVVVARQEVKRMWQENANGGKDIVETMVTVQDELITKTEALNQSQSEQKRIQELMIGQRTQELADEEAAYKKSIGRMDQWKNKVVELDDLLKNLTRDITINLKVNGMEQLDKIQGIVGSAVTSPFSSSPAAASPASVIPAGSTQPDGGFQPGGNPWDYYQVGDAFYWGDGTYGGPAFERGTERVTKTQLALVHKDEKITPAGQTPSGTQQTAPSIIIQGGIPITIVGSNKNPAEIADEVARVVVSRINQLQSQRFRKTG